MLVIESKCLKENKKKQKGEVQRQLYSDLLTTKVKASTSILLVIIVLSHLRHLA